VKGVVNVTGKQWVEAFIESLFELKERANSEKYNNSDTLWTEFMVKEVMKEVMAKKVDCQVTCRDQDDNKNSGEYLNIDAMFFNKSDYTPEYQKSKTEYDPRVIPAVIVEHENEGSGEDKIAHCLWKLLCVRSGLRVLICYHKNIEEIKEFLEKTIRNSKLVNGLTDDELFVIIGNSLKNKILWEKPNDIKEYFSIFEWKNNRLERFVE
jgi:hypothetical protein